MTSAPLTFGLPEHFFLGGVVPEWEEMGRMKLLTSQGIVQMNESSRTLRYIKVVPTGTPLFSRSSCSLVLEGLH